MQLLILLIIAIALGYGLSRSKLHEMIDRAVQQPGKSWHLGEDPVKLSEINRGYIQRPNTEKT